MCLNYTFSLLGELEVAIEEVGKQNTLPPPQPKSKVKSKGPGNISSSGIKMIPSGTVFFVVVVLEKVSCLTT